MTDFVVVWYKCACMPAEAPVRVPCRLKNEDAADWVENRVAVSISADHLARSPLCTRIKMEYCKIPAPENAPYLGGKPVTH